jgi:drug/metabolite transporter (DMT)-like permease
MNSTGILLALFSAALFGASTPIAKLLLGVIDPWALAGLLYLGSGISLGAVIGVRRLTGAVPVEARLTVKDLPWVTGSVLAGGVIAPVLLMFGLARTEASTAALLLNLESLATLGIAWVIFREHVSLRILLGAAVILAGAILLSWRGGSGKFGLGALAIAVACLCWGIDNNLTRRLSTADPIQIAAIKGLVAGVINLALALSQGAHLPAPPILLGAGAVGSLGYGVSLVLFILALRHLGTGRTSAYFATAPFIGATLGVILLGDPLTLRLGTAGLLMAGGVALHVGESHEHTHRHEAMDHEHAHRHDKHHQHQHERDDPAGEPHSHRHRHATMVHTHPHYPDVHHRHTH